MLQELSKLVVADNSGAKLLGVIRVMGSTGKRFAYLGEQVKCSVKKATPGGTVKKGEVVTAVIVRVKKEYRRADGSYIRFGENAAVIINKDNEMVGTRVFGPVARELRSRGYLKLVSLAPEVL